MIGASFPGAPPFGDDDCLAASDAGALGERGPLLSRKPSRRRRRRRTNSVSLIALSHLRETERGYGATTGDPIGSLISLALFTCRCLDRPPGYRREWTDWLFPNRVSSREPAPMLWGHNEGGDQSDGSETYKNVPEVPQKNRLIRFVLTGDNAKQTCAGRSYLTGNNLPAGKKKQRNLQKCAREWAVAPPSESFVTIPVWTVLRMCWERISVERCSTVPTRSAFCTITTTTTVTSSIISKMTVRITSIRPITVSLFLLLLFLRIFNRKLQNCWIGGAVQHFPRYETECHKKSCLTCPRMAEIHLDRSLRPVRPVCADGGNAGGARIFPRTRRIRTIDRFRKSGGSNRGPYSGSVDFPRIPNLSSKSSTIALQSIITRKRLSNPILNFTLSAG